MGRGKRKEENERKNLLFYDRYTKNLLSVWGEKKIGFGLYCYNLKIKSKNSFGWSNMIL